MLQSTSENFMIIYKNKFKQIQINYTELNRYDKLIFLLISLQAFGGFGGFLQPVRFMILLLLPFLLTSKNFNLKAYKYELITFYIWIVYGTISLIWVYFMEESIKEILYLIIYFAGFFVLIYLSSNAKQPKESIIKGWIFLFIITIPVAVVELFYDIHLPSAYDQEAVMMNFQEIGVLERRFASINYGNLNGYNVILIYTLPFVLSIQLSNLSKVRKLLGWTVFIMLSSIILMNGSRGAFLSLLIIVAVFILYYTKNIKTLIYIVILISLPLLYFLFTDNEINKLISARFIEQGIVDNTRLNLIQMGLQALRDSNFMGIGAADFNPTMKYKYNQELTSSHNFFLEVLVQYGVLIFILFIGLFIRIFNNNKSNDIKTSSFIVISSLCIYPLSSIITSGYIQSAWTWLFIASLYVVADKRFEK